MVGTGSKSKIRQLSVNTLNLKMSGSLGMTAKRRRRKVLKKRGKMLASRKVSLRIFSDAAHPPTNKLSPPPIIPSSRHHDHPAASTTKREPRQNDVPSVNVASLPKRRNVVERLVLVSGTVVFPRGY